MGIPPISDDEQALMTAIAAGDREAFARFYDRYSPPVFAYCLRALHDRSDAEDLLLDIFAEIWERSSRYDASRSKPFTYLMNLTRARLIDRLRSRAARHRQPERNDATRDAAAELKNTSSPAAGPVADVVAAEQRSRVLRALEELTADQRQVVEMAFFDAFSQSEIAEKLGRPLGTVKSRVRQAMARLRDLLSGDSS
jgi:RNA polymerase sigma-70 factor (ECF subfamily)